MSLTRLKQRLLIRSVDPGTVGLYRSNDNFSLVGLVTVLESSSKVPMYLIGVSREVSGTLLRAVRQRETKRYPTPILHRFAQRVLSR